MKTNPEFSLPGGGSMENLIGQTSNCYKIISLLGEAAWARYIKPQDLTLQRDVAIKRHACPLC